jgi:ribosomal-protein-alanine N-acetyltransferase
MQLLPIDIDDTKNNRFRDTPACRDLLDVYAEYYQLNGYNPPWIGYFAVSNAGEPVGAGGYKGMPKEGKVEIAYTTFNGYEGQGIGTEICRQLVLLSLQTNSSIQITARTLPDGESSKHILARNGFTCRGTIHDDEDGEVLEWTLTDATYFPTHASAQ